MGSKKRAKATTLDTDAKVIQTGMEFVRRACHAAAQAAEDASEAIELLGRLTYALPSTLVLQALGLDGMIREACEQARRAAISASGMANDAVWVFARSTREDGIVARLDRLEELAKAAEDYETLAGQAIGRCDAAVIGARRLAGEFDTEPKDPKPKAPKPKAPKAPPAPVTT